MLTCTFVQPLKLALPQPTRLPIASPKRARAIKRNLKERPTWLFEDSEVGFPTSKLRVGELHDTVVHWVGAEDRVRVIRFWNKIKSHRVLVGFFKC